MVHPKVDRFVERKIRVESQGAFMAGALERGRPGLVRIQRPIDRIADDVESPLTQEHWAMLRMSRRIRPRQTLHGLAVQIVRVIVNAHAIVFAMREMVRFWKFFGEPGVLRHRIRREDDLLRKALLRKATDQFLVNIKREFLGLVVVDARESHAAKLRITFRKRLGFQAEGIHP